MNDSIRVIGLKFSAKHGVHPEEKVLNQPFEVDVEVRTDLSGPAVSDNLDDTVNYSLIVNRVEEVVNGASCDLIEKLAGLIIESVSELIKSGEVTVRVRKPNAPLKIPFETVEVELKRTI
ncbi:dihydroneopterin aldolase [Candidatus Latescibacterota bacterium]